MEPKALNGRDLLRIGDWSRAELTTLLDLAAELKRRNPEPVPGTLLPGRALGLVFEKPSTRTRVSFAVAMAQLGGTAVPLASSDLQLGRGESLRDTALVLSRYLDALVVRTFRQADVEELALHATVPVLNGLTDDYHPCQALADLLTIRERFGGTSGVRVAYLGDGNNVCHDLMTVCALFGIDFVCATPRGYEPKAAVVGEARAAAAAAGSSLDVVTDPAVAAEGADVLYTDVWTSMGQEDERERRLADLASYAVDEAALALASDRAIVMHCLPAHYGEEVSEAILHGPRSAAWDQAENRLHAQKALLALVVP